MAKNGEKTEKKEYSIDCWKTLVETKPQITMVKRSISKSKVTEQKEYGGEWEWLKTADKFQTKSKLIPLSSADATSQTLRNCTNTHKTPHLIPYTQSTQLIYLGMFVLFPPSRFERPFCSIVRQTLANFLILPLLFRFRKYFSMRIDERTEENHASIRNPFHVDLSVFQWIG